MKYKKNTNRLKLKAIDANTKEVLFEVPNQRFNDIGDFFSDATLSQIMRDKFGSEIKNHDQVILVVSANFFLE